MTTSRSADEPMTLERALQTAIDYERRVHAVYQRASVQIRDPVGRKIFDSLALEEEGHVAFLQAKQRELAERGVVIPEPVDTAVPSPEAIARGVAAMEQRTETRDRDEELAFLREALEAETRTSQFYEELVAQLDGAGRELFRPFLDIERGHRDLVQAEIDALTGTGFWFDMAEFRLEGA